MIYLLAIFLPPLAVLLKGKPISAVINFGLWMLFIIPGIIHAFIVIGQATNKKRHKEQLNAIKGNNPNNQ